MTTEEREIQLVREFRAGLAEASPDRLARIRARLSDKAAPGSRWSVRNLAVPAVAAAAVLAVAVVSGVLAFDGDGGSTPPAATPSEEPQDSQKTASNPDLPGAAAHQNAVQLLERFAGAAGDGPAPLTVPNGQLLYVRGAGQSGNSSYSHEMWVDVNGSIPLMIRRTDDGQITVLTPDPANPKDNHNEEVAAQRLELTTKGPSLRLSTPEYLATLPTDTDGMATLLRTLSPPDGAWSDDHAIFDALRQFLYTNEPLITPRVRAAMYRALARLESVSSTGQLLDVNGRKVYAIAQTERGQSQELLIDAETGRFVGSRSVTSGDSSLDFVDLWTHAIVAKPGDTP